MMAIWRVGVLLLFVSVLASIVHGQNESSHQHHGNGKAMRYEIVAEIYSGKTNPTVTILEAVMTTADKKIIEDVKKWHEAQKPSPEFRQMLGWRGFSLLHKDNKDVVLHTWILPKCSNDALEKSLAELFPLERKKMLLNTIKKCIKKTV